MSSCGDLQDPANSDRMSTAVSIAQAIQTMASNQKMDTLLEQNRKWATEKQHQDPGYFDRLCAQQAPEYLWIGCADSRVPANVILGLEPGEVFTQRNVGNQATHTDLNCQSCLEYAVSSLKVKTIICCGHYGCGAVKAALNLPSKTPGLVNCWISDIRECRNQHRAELKALDTEAQMDRLCELNVLRQTFHVCTSPVVQNAWAQGQEVNVYGMIYDLKDGLMRRLVGPLTKDSSCLDMQEFERELSQSCQPHVPITPNLTCGASIATSGSLDCLHMDRQMSLSSARVSSPGSQGPITPDMPCGHERNTAELASMVAQHVGWSEAGVACAPEN